MGVLPLQFPEGVTRKTLQLKGDETINLRGLENVAPGMKVTMEVISGDGRKQSCELDCRLDTALEVAYFTSGGIMPYVVRKLAGN